MWFQQHIILQQLNKKIVSNSQNNVCHRYQNNMVHVKNLHQTDAIQARKLFVSVQALKRLG